MTNTREASHRWVMQRLGAVLPGASPKDLEERADTLVMIAEQYEVPIEVLLRWIDFTVTDKQWSALEWRRFCELYGSVIQVQREGG